MQNKILNLQHGESQAFELLDVRFEIAVHADQQVDLVYIDSSNQRWVFAVQSQLNSTLTFETNSDDKAHVISVHRIDRESGYVAVKNASNTMVLARANFLFADWLPY